MDPSCELIESFLKSSGLSCDDLLSKIQQYKLIKSKPNLNEEISTSELNCSENSQDEQQYISNNNTVILETKSSTVDLNKIVDVNETETQAEKIGNEEVCTVAASDNSKDSSEIIQNLEITVDCQQSEEKSANYEVKKSVTTEEKPLEKPPCENIKNENDETRRIGNEDVCTVTALDNSKDGCEIIQNLEITVDCQQSEKKSANYEVKKSVTTEEKPLEEHVENIRNENDETTSNDQQLTKISDHDYINPVTDRRVEETSNSSVNEPQSTDIDFEGEMSPSNTGDLPQSEDNLRNIIRMQLSSLRNMKKSNGCLPDLKKKSMFFHNLKKKRKSCDVNPTTSTSGSDDKKEENEVVTSNDDSLVSLADETDFMIVNVTGGVDLLAEREDPKEEEERRFAVITDSSKEEKSSWEPLNNKNDKTSPRKDINNILTNYRRKMSLNYFDANSYKFSNPRKDERPLNIMVKKNISENFNKDPGINKSIKNNEKSPFVSDSLDDFLNESSQLKISYPIPKLGAEEGICENTKQSPYDNIGNRVPRVETTNEQDTPQKEKPKLVKAKTLADMRRHFEKLKAREKSTTASHDKKIKAVKEKEVCRKFKERDPQNSNDEITVPKPRSRKISKPPPHRNCFIMYDDTKLLTTGKNKDQCVAIINSKVDKQTFDEKIVSSKPKPALSSCRRPSLLSSLTPNKSWSRVKYKPGPLCKKIGLQNIESRDKWKTELKALPKICLEITPQVNKPIDPKLVHLLPIFNDPIITEERVEFALSVLKPQKEVVEQKTFTFHIPYNNNQENMVIRKRCTPLVPKEIVKTESSNRESDVAKILSDIITYVETKEIEKTIIKEDDTAQAAPEEKENESNVKTKVRKVKRKKLDLELLRLNCKVIDVATTEIESKDCSKPYCRLGCICKSLLCEGVFSNHCQLVECMFGCKCQPATSIEMTANNSLSVHTVNHLEDKAKKNLAKEEREFTHTLIHTDNDVILVGAGKMRRSSKPPKKFTDYVADDVIFDDSEHTVPEKKNLKLKNCTIPLQKLELFDIQPYCFSHYVYNCPCNGETIDLPPPKKSKFDQIPKIRIVKTKEDQHKAWYDSCARIRTVFPEYKERNKNPLYNEKLLKTNGYKRKDMKNKAENQQVEENITIHELIIPTNDETSTEPRPVKKATKRKQSFNVRQENVLNISPDYAQEDVNSREFAIQRRRKKIKPNIVTVQNSIFDGEIKVSLKENKEMLNIIGPENAALEYLRILPWSKLIECYRSRKISIWSKNKRSSAILCNAAGYFPPKEFRDIRDVSDRSSIIDWILTDSLPPDRPRELMHVILTPKKNHFLIAGYCLKKIDANKDQLDISSASEGRENAHTTPASCISIESPRGFEEISITRSEVENKSTTISLLKPNELRFSDKPIITKAESLLLKKLPLILPKPVESSQSSEETVTNDTISPKILNIIKLPSATQIIPVPQKTIKLKKFEVVSTRQSISAKSNIDIFTNGKKSIKLGTLCKQTRPRVHLPVGRIIEQSIENTIISSLLNSPVPDGNTKEADSSSQTTDSLALEEKNINNNKSLESGVNNLQEDTANFTYVDVEVVSTENPVEDVELLKSKSTTKTSEKTKKADSVVLSKITTTEEKQAPTSPKKSTSPKSRNNFQQNLTSNRSMKCTHKDMYNENKTLILTNKEFAKRKLYFSKNKKRAEIVLPLPKVSQNSRWRLVYLQSDFTFLTFVNANYSVKYTDLMDVVKMSNNIRKTITLRNKEFSDRFKDPLFGIFCVPDYQDRLFIGPYAPNEKHNIERLRYLQGRLIDTYMFNTMLGIKDNEKGPVWVFESPTLPSSLPNGIIIDITEDEDHEITVVDLDSDSSEAAQLNINSQPLTNYLLSPPFVEELTAEELKSKQNVNRYIITNIPHLGYFGASQRDNKAIEVFWPDGNVGYRFPNVTFAKNVLIQYLSQIFCPIPQDFKINVVIMTHLDLQTNKPVDTRYFSKPGPYVCGDFGIFEKNEIPDDLLKRNNIPSIEFLLKVHQEAQEHEDAIIKIFGLFLMSNEELRQHPESGKILQWASSEIYILEKLAENYESEKADLDNIIRMNSQKLKEKTTGDTKVNNNSTPKVSETIEITDSDEEENQASSANNTSCTFKEISSSGKIENNSFYPKSDNRSLLKPKTWTHRRSLLKN